MVAMQRYVSKELTHLVGRNHCQEIKDEKQRREAQYRILLKNSMENAFAIPLITLLKGP
jgi:hypothetical protein